MNVVDSNGQFDAGDVFQVKLGLLTRIEGWTGSDGGCRRCFVQAERDYLRSQLGRLTPKP